MEIEKELYAQIKDYCKVNNLKIGEYVNSLLKSAFMRDKYGERPFFQPVRQEPQPVKEKIPIPSVEPLKEKEIVIEAPTEKIEEKPIPEVKKEETITPKKKSNVRKLN